jgi:hypothetical protein
MDHRDRRRALLNPHALAPAPGRTSGRCWFVSVNVLCPCLMGDDEGFFTRDFAGDDVDGMTGSPCFRAKADDGIHPLIRMDC